jgi:hypothetical protein
MKINVKQLRRLIKETQQEMMDEMWGAGAHEYKRDDGHRTGDVGGHYKDYMGEEDHDEDEDEDLKKEMHGQGYYDKEDESLGMRHHYGEVEDDLSPGAERDESYGDWGHRGKDWGGKNENTRITKSRLDRIIQEEIQRALAGLRRR